MGAFNQVDAVEIVKIIIELGIIPTAAVLIRYFISANKRRADQLDALYQNFEKRENLLIAESSRREDLMREESSRREKLMRTESEKRENILMANFERIGAAMDRISSAMDGIKDTQVQFGARLSSIESVMEMKRQ